MQQKLSPKQLRQRKFFVVLPLLVVPFFTLFLVSLGIIGSTQSKAQTNTGSGLNARLPGALPAKDSNWNKLQFYEQADKDSAQYRTQQKNDPNYSLPPKETIATADTPVEKYADRGYTHYQPPHPGGVKTDTDANEEKVYRKLAQLNQQLDESKLQDKKSEPTAEVTIKDKAASVNTNDINRLENMMQDMQGGNGGADPEMQQISGMLEKILDIQHPERVQDKIQQQSKQHQRAVYPVSVKDAHTSISLLQGRPTDSARSFLSGQQSNAFYSLGEFTREDNEHQDAVSAIIPETQVLVNGATVKLQLTSEVYINGSLIPANQLIYGIAVLDGERLTININSIRYQQTILPVALSVYDMDGIAGIYMPGAITRDVAKQSTDQAIQSIGLASLDPSVGAQAASAGIQAAKSLIGRKVKLVKVTVKAGYRVLLRDNKASDNIAN